mgnify:CR=1 FL=1
MSLRFDVVARRLAATVISRPLEASVLASRLVAEIVAGQFFKTLQIADQFFATDLQQTAFGKGLSDIAGLTEDVDVDFGKTLQDAYSIDEAHVIDFAKSLSDGGSAQDDPSLAVGKLLTDAFAASESLDRIVSYSRDFDDSAGATDAEFRSIGKNLPTGTYFSDYTTGEYFAQQYSGVPSELIGVSESLDPGLGKFLADAFSADESLAVSYGLNLADPVFATDDLDGEASAEDDQEMQFFKSLSEAPAVTSLFERAVDYSRSFSNASSMTDDDVLVIGKNINEFIGLPETVEKDFDKSPSENPIVVDLAALALSRSLSDSGSIDETSVKLVGKNLGDAASVGDSGSFRGQGYSDFTYFADDYVGFAGTFN